MSSGLQKLLEYNREKKKTKERERCIVKTLNVRKRKPLPKEKFDPSTGKSSARKSDQCFIIIPDVHSYLRDDKAFDLCMESLPILNKMYNVTKVIQLGDLLECGEYNNHPQACPYEEMPTYSEEVQWAIDEFWKPVQKACPKANYYALMGNHENRLSTYIVKAAGRNEIAAEIFDSFMPTQVYEELGVNVTPYGTESVTDGVLEIFPGLVCIHGWSAAMNAAKTHLDQLTGGMSMIFGHTHRIQSYVKRNPITNEQVGAWSFGALARNNMLWNKGRPTQHNLGFGIVLTHGKEFKVITLEIKIAGDKRTLFLPDGTIMEK